MLKIELWTLERDKTCCLYFLLALSLDFMSILYVRTQKLRWIQVQVWNFNKDICSGKEFVSKLKVSKQCVIRLGKGKTRTTRNQETVTIIKVW